MLGIAVVALAFTAAGSFATPSAVAHGFRAAAALCAGISVAGALAGAFAPRTAGETDATPAPSPVQQEART